MKISRVLALALALMLLVAACGGGDDGEDDTGAAPSDAAADAHAEHEAFCETVVDAETAVVAVASGGDPSAVEGLITEVEETAPAELEEPVQTVVTTVREALENQDDTAFEAPAFSEADEEIDQWVVANCGFETYEISAVEYEFQGVPETIPAGKATLVFNNDGKEIHEMIMVRYKDDTLTIDDLMEMSDKEAEAKLEFLGAAFGPPGTVDAGTRDFAPGKYALVCFVPVGATSEKAARSSEGPPHVARGMSAEFTVE
jgi:hypothetical protein